MSDGGARRLATVLFTDMVGSTEIAANSAMDSYIYGFALQEKTLPFETPEEYAGVVQERARAIADDHPFPADRYPYLFEIVVELGASGYDYDEEFVFGLESDPRWDRAGVITPSCSTRIQQARRKGWCRG